MVEDAPYETVECESFDAFSKEHSGLDDRWVFRGQGDPDWELASTLYR